MSSLPIVQLGRSWFVELKKNSSGSLRAPLIEPYKLTLQIQKSVDPLSGMTVNLMTLEQAWSQAEDLKEGIWPSALDFFKSLAKKWQPWIHQEQAQLIRMKLESLQGDGWELSPTGLNYKTMVRWQGLEEKNQMPRKTFLTSKKALGAADLEDFLKKSSSTSRNQLQALLQQSPYCRFEIFDSFEQFIEFEIQTF